MSKRTLISGKKVQQLRAKAGLTQPAFATALGASFATCQRWESTGMSAALWHQACMLFDDEYAAEWIEQQAKTRPDLRARLGRLQSGMPITNQRITNGSDQWLIDAYWPTPDTLRICRVHGNVADVKGIRKATASYLKSIGTESVNVEFGT